jgi:protein associated with RNAse G/E
VRWSNGTVEVLDEDEFSEHKVLFDYPPRLVDTVRATTARLALAVDAQHEPFGEVAVSWMAQARSLTEAAGG